MPDEQDHREVIAQRTADVARSTNRGCLWVVGIIVIVFAIAAIGAALGGDDEPGTVTLARFESALEDETAGCQLLFALTDGMAEADRATAKRTLVQVGCSTRTATRQSTTTLGDAVASAPCIAAFREAEAADFEAADAKIAITLTACSGYDEWLAALHQHAGAFGMEDYAPNLGPLEVEIACRDDGSRHEGSPVCVDARAKGIY